VDAGMLARNAGTAPPACSRAATRPKTSPPGLRAGRCRSARE